ncbi:hypothetical protein L1887_05939 [Cichorium endivia]|nr:hypothetical protein L1887_05939 [Cichorium endivia]
MAKTCPNKKCDNRLPRHCNSSLFTDSCSFLHLKWFICSSIEVVSLRSVFLISNSIKPHLHVTIFSSN